MFKLKLPQSVTIGIVRRHLNRVELSYLQFAQQAFSYINEHMSVNVFCLPRKAGLLCLTLHWKHRVPVVLLELHLCSPEHAAEMLIMIKPHIRHYFLETHIFAHVDLFSLCSNTVQTLGCQ